MPDLIVIPDAVTANLPTPVTKATSRNGQHETTLTAWAGDAAQAGVWGCDAGEFTTARVGFHEVCQILTGSGPLTSDDGEVAELRAGSTVVIPDGWRGVWRIDEPMRKTFVIVTTQTQGGPGA
jgi:uncharacterized cupin superfamily protein